MNQSSKRCNDSVRSLSQVRPHMDLTFENLLAHINTVYVLVTKNDSSKSTKLAAWTDESDDDSQDIRLKVFVSMK